MNRSNAMKLIHALLIASVMILQSCASSNQTKPPAAGPIVQVAPPFDPGHYYAEDTAPDRPKIPRVELYNPSVSAVPPRAVAEVQQILAQYGITQTVKTCDLASSTEPCWDYLEDWVNDDSGIPSWRADFKDISSTLKNCEGTGRYLSLGLPMDPRIFTNAPVMQVNDAEVFVLDTYCVDASAVTNLANRKPPVRIHILNRALLNFSIATPASSHTEVTKAVDIPGTFHARFLNFKSDYSMSADYPTIQLDADQGYAGDGTTKIMLDEASRAKIQVQVLPAAHSLWEGLYNIGPTLTDIPQTPFRAAATSESGLVQPANGGVWLTHLDQELGLAQTRDSLSLARTYNSQNDQFGPFGYSWSAPFSEREKYFRFDSATGEVGPLTKLTFLGDGRFFSRELGPFFDPNRPELKPDIKKTNLFYTGEPGYEAESFTLNGIQTSRCDTISKNCLTFFSAGNRITFVGDQIFFRNTPAAIKQVLDTLHGFDALSSSKASETAVSLNLAAKLANARQKFNYTNGRSLNASPDIHGHFVYFVWGAKTIKWAVYSTGKVIRYLYGEPTGALKDEGEFLREVRGIVSERNYNPSSLNEYNIASIPSGRIQERVYYQYKYLPRDSLTNWTGGLLKSVDSYARQDEILNIEYTDPIINSDLGLYGYAPIATKVQRDDMQFSYDYDFKNEARAKVCDNENVYSVREFAVGQNGRMLPRKYVLDRSRGFLLESYGPTETRDYSGDNSVTNRLLQVSLDPKTLKIASKVVRGQKVENTFSNGLLATSTAYRPNIYASVCDSFGDVEGRTTVYGTTKVIRNPYFFDLSGAETPISVSYPDVVKQGGQIVKRTVSQIPGSKPSCSGGVGITYDSATQVTSGAECRVVENPLGGSDSWTYAKATFMGSASSAIKFERGDELKPFSISDAEILNPYEEWRWKQADYWKGVHRPDFVSQVGYIVKDRLNGVTKINTGSGLSTSPVVRKYRDAYGKIVFTQHPLGGVTRYLWSNEFPSPILRATFSTEASVPAVDETSFGADLDDLYFLINRVDSLSSNLELKKELQEMLRVCPNGDASNCAVTSSSGRLGVGEDSTLRYGNMYHTLRLTSATSINADISNTAYPLTAPSIQFKAGSPLTKFEYDHSRALLTKTTQILSGGYKNAGTLTEPVLSFDGESVFSISSSPKYCFQDSGTGCFSPRSVVGGEDSKNTKTRTLFRDGQDFGAFMTITDSRPSSGLLITQSSGGDLGLEYDEFGNNLKTVIMREGPTNAAKKETIVNTYTPWLNIDTTTHTLDIAEENSLSGRSESTHYEYYDDAAGLVQMTEKKGFFNPTPFVTSYEYDNALKAIKVDDETIQKTTTISLSGGSTASWDREIIQTETMPKSLNGDSTTTELETISKLDGAGNIIESCVGPISGSCSNKESTIRNISSFGYAVTTTRKVKTSSGGLWDSVVIKSTPDSFGQPLLEREAASMNFDIASNTDAKFVLKATKPDNYLWSAYNRNYGIDGDSPFPTYINQQLAKTSLATFGFTRACETTGECEAVVSSPSAYEFKPLEYNKTVTHPLGQDTYTCQSNSTVACANNSHALSLLTYSKISINPDHSIKQEKVDLNSDTTTTTLSRPDSQRITLASRSAATLGNSQTHTLDPILGTTMRSLDLSKDPWDGILKQSIITQQSDALGRPSGVLTVKEGAYITKETSFVYRDKPAATSITTKNHLFNSAGEESGLVTSTTNYTYLDGALEHLPSQIEILTDSGSNGNQSGSALQLIKYSGSGEPQETTYNPTGPNDYDQVIVESTMSSNTDNTGQLLGATTELKFRSPTSTGPLGDLVDRDGITPFNRNPALGLVDLLPVDPFKTSVSYESSGDSFEGVSARKISMKVDGFKIADFTIGDGQYRRTAGRILKIKTGMLDPVYVQGVDLEQMGIEPTSGKIDDGGIFWNIYQSIFGSDHDLNLTSMGLDLSTPYGGSINLAGPKGYKLGFENSSSGYYLKTASPKSNTPFGVSLTEIPHSVSAMTPPSPMNFDTSCDSMQMAATGKFSTSGDGANYVYNRENPIINSRLSQVRPQTSSLIELPPAPPSSLKPTVVYDERGLKKRIVQSFTIPAKGALPDQNWVVIRNYSNDAQGNPALVEIITYFKGGEVFRNWTPVAITQYINTWLPTPDAMLFGRKYFLARQFVRDGIFRGNPEVRLNPDAPAGDENPVIHYAHPLFREQGDGAGQTAMSSLFYYVPSDQGPIAALRLIQDYSQCYAGNQTVTFNADGTTNAPPRAGVPGVGGGSPSGTESSLNPIPFGPVTEPTFCAYRATYDQLGNFMGLGKYVGSKRVKPLDTKYNKFLPPPDMAIYSPYGTAAHLRVFDDAAKRSGDTYRYDINQSEVYLDSDPRFGMFPTFGAQGEFSDGLLSGMAYDSFSGRMIRNDGSFYESTSTCGQSQNVKALVGKFLAMGKGITGDSIFSSNGAATGTQAERAEQIYANRKLDISNQLGFMNFLGPTGMIANFLIASAYTRLEMNHAGLQIHRTGADALAGGLLEAGYMAPFIGSCGLGVVDSLIGHQYGQTAMNAGYCALDIAGLFTGGGSTAASTAARVGTRSALATASGAVHASRLALDGVSTYQMLSGLSELEE